LKIGEKQSGVNVVYPMTMRELVPDLDAKLDRTDCNSVFRFQTDLTILMLHHSVGGVDPGCLSKDSKHHSECRPVITNARSEQDRNRPL
jgi:hypothetical protein